MAAEIALKQTHLKTSAEQEQLRRRVERLRADLANLESKAATTQAELAVIELQLERR